MSFAGRKILFIGIGFYDYEKCIADRIKDRGGDITFYIDRPALLCKWPWGGVLSRLPIIRSYLQKKHENNILLMARAERFDQVLFIKAVDCSFDFIYRLKEMLPDSEFILYQWDSLKRFPSIHKKLPLFDRVLSFDKEDSNNHSVINFRPLFFREVAKSSVTEDRFDIVFIGLLHSSRLSGVRKIQQLAAENGLSMYVYMTTSFVTWFKLWLKNQVKDIYIKQLLYNKVISINKRARIVLDLPHPEQMGLTMRAIEALGLDMKMMTTSKDIINYDFYHKINIAIIDLEAPRVSTSFFNAPYEKLDEEIIKNYTLDKWLDDVFFYDNKI